MATSRPLTSAQLRKKYKFVVPVPPTPAGAYNPDRPVGGLVSAQLQHLQFVTQALPGWHHAGAKAADVKTESGAAAFVAHATNLLQRASAPAKAKPPKPPRRKAKPARRKKAAARRPVRRGRRS
jgi:hypothetical protein